MSPIFIFTYKYLILFINFLLIHYYPNCLSQFIQPGLCDTQCHCPKNEGVVHCDRQDRLLGVPTNIPSDVTKLYIQHNNFPTPNYLSRINMTGLEQLENLRIIYCNLQVIEPKTFIDMTKLKHLDLSHNSILRLESYTFYGLQLINLYLQEQRTLNDQSLYISEGAFHGLNAIQINLRGNHISMINYDIFAKVPNLDRLILSDNYITHIDNGFETYFNHPERLLDLTSNPLECNCQLAWIIARLNDWANSLRGLNMTCIHYLNKYNNNNMNLNEKIIYELGKLNADQLCPTSRIKHVWIDIVDDASQALISCTAITIPKFQTNLKSTTTNNDKSSTINFLNNVIPNVAWRYIENGQLREVKRLQSNTNNQYHDNNNNNNNNNQLLLFSNNSEYISSATVQLNISLNSQINKYTCTTWDNKKQTDEVLLTLKGPKYKFNSKLLHNNNNDNNNNNNLSYYSDSLIKMKMNEKQFISNSKTEILLEQPHYLFQKQFTLLEMIGAVIGTFLGTLSLLFIGAKCLQFCNHYPLVTMKNRDSKTIYQAGEIMKIDQNLSDSNITQIKSNGINRVQLGMLQCPTNPSQYTHIVSHGNFSPLLNQQTNLTTQLLAVNGGLSANHHHHHHPQQQQQQQQQPSSLLSSSNTGNDELHTNLALFTSTPLLHPSNFRTLPPNETGLSHFVTTTQPHLTHWIIPPGSPYSLTGSHEYDVPRVGDLQTENLTVSSGSVN